MACGGPGFCCGGAARRAASPAAVQRREAEREGWRDFQEELKRQRRSGSLVADEDAQAQALRQELDRVQAESDAMLRTERPMRNAL